MIVQRAFGPRMTTCQLWSSGRNIKLTENPRYAVSDTGEIWMRRGRKPDAKSRFWDEWIQHKQQQHPSGHLYVGCGNSTRQVHRLVLCAFGGIPLPGQECRHLDGDPTNNNISNLCWGSRAQNCDDKKRHGTDNRGDRHYAAKISNREAELIRNLRRRHPGKFGICRFLAEWFRLSQSQVSAISLGNAY